MISLRLAVPSVLIAAALAGCLTYFVTPSQQPPLPVGADQPSPPGRQVQVSPTNIDTHIREMEPAGAYEEAAEAILKRVPNTQAHAGEPPIRGHIPLPKRRPIRRP